MKTKFLFSLMLFTVFFVNAQTILVEWTFPNNPDNATVDIYSNNPDNSAMSITSSQSVAYSYSGATTYSARATNWNSGSGSKYWQIELNTFGHSSLLLYSKQRGSNTGPRDFKAQYKIGTSGTWTNITGATSILVADNWTGGVLSGISLPSACNNQPNVFIRWIMTSNTSVNGGTVASTGAGNIDDIKVTGTMANEVFYFRSKQNGNFNTVSTWENSTDNSNWTNAGFTPTYKNNTITIQSGHTVTITATDTLDQLTVNGTLIYGDYSGSTLRINNETGIDFIINGTFEDLGPNSISWASNTTWEMGSNGTIIRTRSTSANNWRDHYNNGISNIPVTSNWIIRKIVSDSPSLSSTGGMYYPNLTIENNTGSIWETGSSPAFNGGSDYPRVKGNFDIGGNGTGNVSFLNENTNATPVLVAGNLTVKSGSTLRNFGTGFEIQGNLTVNGTINYDSDGDRKLVFSGSRSQNISGSGTLNIYTLEINKSSNLLSLSRGITIDNSLTLTTGNISLSTYDLQLSPSATIIGNSSSSYVVTNSTGKINKLFSVTGSFTFPTGDDSNYTPFSITLNSATFGSNAVLSVKVINSKEPHISTATDYINRYWDVNATDITGLNADVNYIFANGDITGTETNLSAMRWNSINNFKEIGTIDTNNNTATASAIYSFGNFTALGKTFCTHNNFAPEVSCDLVGNGDFSHVVYESDWCQLTLGCVSNWCEYYHDNTSCSGISYGNPSPGAFINPPGCIYTDLYAPYILPDKQYLLVYDIQSEYVGHSVFFNLANSSNSGLVCGSYLQQQQIPNSVNIADYTTSNENWVNQCIPFSVASNSYDQLVITTSSIYPDQTLILDNIAIYSVELGNDKYLSCTVQTTQLDACSIPGATYSWTPTTGLSNPNIANPIASPSVTTTYTLTVQVGSDQGCTLTDNITVHVSNPVASITATNVSCWGGNDGTATVTTSNGTPPYTYSWNTTPVQHTAQATNLYPGYYQVTVTDNNGCTVISSYVGVFQPAQLTSYISWHTNAPCNSGNSGDNTGSAIVTASGGTLPFTYLWNTTPPQTTNPASLLAGVHTVTVTDAHGCSSTTSVTITEPPLLTASITSNNSPLCVNQSSGSATLTASGGISPYIYFWNTTPGQNNANAINLHAGTYTVAIFDHNNCSTETNVTITDPIPLEITSYTVDDNTCQNTGSINNITVTGGTISANYYFTWSDNTHNFTLDNLSAGNYLLTVSDDNGCAVIQSFIVNDNILCCTSCDYILGTNSNWVGFSSAIFGSGSDISIINHTICLYGTLHINNANYNTNFTGCTFNMGANSSIIIDNGSTLTVDNTTIEACYDKWNMISVPNSTCTLNIINGSTIMNSISSVDAEAGGVLNITGSVFSDNEVSIYIHDFNPTVFAYYNANISGNSFTSMGMSKIGIWLNNLGTNSPFKLGTDNSFTQLFKGLMSTIAYDITVNSDNQFKNCRYGIWCQNQNVPTNLNVSFCKFKSCEMAGIWGNLLKVVTILSSDFSNTYYNGIDLTDCNSATINNNIFSGITTGWAITLNGSTTQFTSVPNIMGNTINSVRNGIRCINIAPLILGTISGNTITLDNSSDPGNTRYRGIDIEGCNNIDVNGSNSVTGVNLWNWWQIGIEVENSSFINVECNLVQTIGRGIWLGGVTPNVFIYGNQITDCLDGLVFNFNTLLSEQGYPSDEPPMCGFPSDNQWLGTWDASFQTQTFANATQAGSYSFNVRNTQASYIPTINNHDNWYFPLSTSLNPFVFSSCAALYNCSVAKSLVGKSLETDSLQYELEKKIAKNEIVYIVNEDEYRWAGKHYLYNRMLRDIQMLEVDTIFAFAKDSLMNTNIGTIYNYNTLSADTTVADSIKFSQLTAINNSITPVNTHENNLKILNALNLKIKETGINSLDTTEKLLLVSIANQCPYSGGNAVYSARVICILLGYGDSFENCNDNIFYSSQKSTQLSQFSDINNKFSIVDSYFKLYPNQTSDAFFVEYKLKKGQQAKIEIYNTIGEIVYVEILEGGKNIKSLTLNLSPAIYYCKFVIDNVVFQTEKLIIIK